MKKARSLVLIVFLFIFQHSFAQTLRAKVGLNIATIYLEDGDGAIYQASPVLGFHLGATLERATPISWLSYESGILLSKKGVKTDDNEFKLNLTYLDIPFNIKAIHEIETIKLFGTIGTYVGIGIGGKTVEEYEVFPIKWGSGKDFKRTDFGLSFGAGVEFHSATFGASYQYGVSNASADGINVAKNRVFSLTCGFKL